MADKFTKRRWTAVFRFERDYDGNVTSCEVHERKETYEGEELLKSVDTRVPMDEKTFTKVCGEAVAGALAQIGALNEALKGHAQTIAETERELASVSRELESKTSALEAKTAELEAVREKLEAGRKAIQ